MRRIFLCVSAPLRLCVNPVLVNPRQERQARHDIGFRARENQESLVDRLPPVVQSGKLAKHLCVPGFRFRELLVQAREIRVGEVLGEESEPFLGTGLDEPEKQKAIGEPAPVGSGEPEKSFGVRVAFVSAETPAAREKLLVDEPEMLELFDGEGAHPADELVVVRVGDDEGERRGRSFLLTMGVVVEERVEVGGGDFDPCEGSSGSEHEPL
jgi:hypothetical protein